MDMFSTMQEQNQDERKTSYSEPTTQDLQHPLIENMRETCALFPKPA
jgi:hypothetical protein